MGKLTFWIHLDPFVASERFLVHTSHAAAPGRNESLSFFDAKLHETGAPMGCHGLSQADEWQLRTCIAWYLKFATAACSGDSLAYEFC